MSERPIGPEGEVLDYVERKGPITADQIVEDCGVWSPDDVFSYLQALEEKGLVDSTRGDIEQHGTTRRVFIESGGDFDE